MIRVFRSPAPSHRRPRPFLLLLLLTASLVSATANAKKPKDPEELFNPLLGVQWSHWLVGPIVQIADEKEVDTYLRLTSDEDAAAFVETFWAKRNEDTALFKKTPKDLFDARSEEANKRYTEGTYPGNRTDRGTVLILYGEPDEIAFESPKKVGYPPLEVWEYSKKAEEGLDGKKPKRLYRFVEIKGSTVLYTGQPLRPDPRAKLRIRH